MLDQLPSNYSKSPDSNNAKLFRIFEKQEGVLRETYDRMRLWRDIEYAEGQVLDDLGENINQPRGVATDEVYRVLLKSKLARNLSTGDVNTIIQVLAIALDTDYSTIRIKPKWNDQDDPEPAAIKVIEVPLIRLNQVGLSPDQFARIVQKTVSAGVRVESVQLKGTFEFGGLSLETDSEAGFSDIEGTVGGYFGSAFVPSHDQNLPL